MQQLKLIVTGTTNDDFCKCQYCDKIIAELVQDKMIPSAEECRKEHNVPVPNFGWFCSQECAIEYEQKFGISFARTSEGRIDYYS